MKQKEIPAKLELKPQHQVERCQFFNHKKGRNCQMVVYREGSKYCVHHLLDQSEQQQLQQMELDMIDCPIDPSHQIKRCKLKKHLSKCNKTKFTQEQYNNPFFSGGINQIEKKQEKTQTQKRLKELEGSQIFNDLIESIPKYFIKAVQLYTSHLTNLKVEFDSETIEKYLLDDNDPSLDFQVSYNEKDLLQVQQLVNVLDQHQLLKAQYCYVEYGAGKGRLSHGIAEDLALKNKDIKVCHVLIERESRRLKFDRFHRDNPFYLRLRMDINDFNLNVLNKQLPSQYFEQKNSNILDFVGVCKHMCGGATDLTIQSLLRCSREENTKFQGLLCATCCHHLCDEDTYVNLEFFKELGIVKEHFQLIFACSSWCVSGPIQNNKKIKPNEDDKIEEFKLTSELRTKIGKMAKRIIDIGRIVYLSQQSKLKGMLVRYCDQELSPENFVLLLF